MLASITPLGQRGRGASWRRTVTAYLLGSVAAAAAVGALAGAVGAAAVPATPTWFVLVVGAVALISATSDLHDRRPPSLHRQVDEAWLDRYRDWVHGGGFGLQLGLGVVTIVTSASIYLMLLLELLVGDPAQSALVGVMFGLARGVPLLSTAGIVDPLLLRSSHRQWQRRLPAARLATVAVQTAAGAALLAVGVR